MKITLKNFRCHKNSVYELPDTGLTLLSGISGAGKSSLIKSIFYVLYGKIKKPFSFGTTSCSVELVYKDHTVYRSSRPNVLKVTTDNKTFEDASAQSYIDQWIGLTREEFEITGYIAQKNGSCILSLSPLDQMQTIQTLSFEDSDMLKDRLKGLIKESGKKVAKLDTQLSFAKKEFESITVPDNTEFPENLDTLIDENNELLESLPNEIESYNSNLEKISKDITNTENALKNIERLNIDIKSVKKELKGKRKLREDIRENIKPVNVSISSLKDSIIYLETKKSYDEKLEIETLETNESKKDLLKKIWSREKCEKKKEKLENYRYAAKVSEEIGENLETLYKVLEDSIGIKDRIVETIEASETIVCPRCDGSLKFKDGILIKGKKVNCQKADSEKLEKVKYQLGSISKQIAEIKTNIERLEALDEGYSESKLEALEKSWEANKDYESELKKLNSGYSKELRRLEHKLENLEPCEGDLEEYILLLKEAEIKQIVYNQHVSELKRVEADIMHLTTKLESLNSQVENIDDSSLEILQKSYEETSEKLKNLNKQHKTSIKESKRLEKLSRDLELYKNYTKWESRVENYSKEYSSAELHHNGLLRIKERYRQAEILAVESTLESINQHTQYYLDHFFKENALHARLEIIETDKKKMEIRTVINYKGYEYDNISQLSGGEFDRCVLASVCGVSTMMNCPVMFLDESLSSLDADNNTEILTFLKELSETKLIAVCSHEAIQGIFDHTVKI